MKTFAKQSFLKCNDGKLEEAENFKCGFIVVCLNGNRLALVRELLSYNSLFVGQLYKDKSLTLRARDLIFFTTDLIQTMNYYSTNHCQT